MTRSKIIFRFTIAVTLVLVLAVISLLCYKNSAPYNEETFATKDLTQTPETQEPTIPSSYIIDGVEYKCQDVYTAACETYSCTMLLKYLGFDIDEHMFVESYLITKPLSIYYGYGPDMDAAYAGDVYTGCGVNAPAMATFMNDYLSTTNTDNRAYALKNIGLDELCEEYISKDNPVMVWATTYMQDPGVTYNWTINYVSESSTSNEGDTESWYQNQHCMLLIGYDESSYYFADPMEGKVSVFDKEVSKERYAQLDSQAIVVK